MISLSWRTRSSKGLAGSVGRTACLVTDASPSNPTLPTGFHFRDAFRLLVILNEGSQPSEAADVEPGTRVFVGEKRLMAIDFFVRYPDYLAYELLNLHESVPDKSILEAVAGIFDANEPDVRQVAMIRWRRGAFQNVETALAILDSRRLIRSVVRPLPGDRKQHEFVVQSTASDFIDEAVETQPALGWYVERARLAIRVAGDRSGSALKDAQYAHAEYADAPYGTEIPSIKGRVLERLESIRESNGAQ